MTPVWIIYQNFVRECEKHNHGPHIDESEMLAILRKWNPGLKIELSTVCGCDVLCLVDVDEDDESAWKEFVEELATGRQDMSKAGEWRFPK